MVVFRALHKRVNKWRTTLLPYVRSGTDTVLAFQRACGVQSLTAAPDPNVPKHLRNGKPENPALRTRSSMSPHASTNGIAAAAEVVSDADADAAGGPLPKADVQPNGHANGGHSNGTAGGPASGAADGCEETRVHGRTAAYAYWWPLHYYFCAAAALGNELFYILFFPALFWCVDVTIARRTVTGWVWIYFVGQLLKDILRLPRPPSPPVVRLETHYETEYGFPSTHAAAAVYTPLMLAAVAHELGYLSNAALALALATAALWVVSVCLSRLYMGVHTVVDLIGGLAVGAAVLCGALCVGRSVDAFVTRSAAAAWVVPLLGVAMVAVYPHPERWTNAYGDTTLIIGVGVGVIEAGTVHTGAMHALAFVSLRQSLPLVIARMSIGTVVLFATRALCKAIGFAVLTPFFRPTGEAERRAWNPNRCYATEIPVKLLVYAAVGFNAVYTCPKLYALIGI